MALDSMNRHRRLPPLGSGSGGVICQGLNANNSILPSAGKKPKDSISDDHLKCIRSLSGPKASIRGPGTDTVSSITDPPLIASGNCTTVSYYKLASITCHGRYNIPLQLSNSGACKIGKKDGIVIVNSNACGTNKSLVRRIHPYIQSRLCQQAW
jgi:hypothetical protein